jgi:multicomponent Na+:H+ antiporter subunit F
MSELFNIIAVVLMLNLIGGLYRVYRGPSAADRMLAVQLFGTTAVALLLLLAEGLELPALRDVALIFTLLSAPAIVAFVRLPALLAEDDKP